MSLRGMTEAERALLTHITMWGSAGYPLQKLGTRWTWGTARVPGPPKVFSSKRAATESFESFYRVLLDAHAVRL